MFHFWQIEEDPASRDPFQIALKGARKLSKIRSRKMISKWSKFFGQRI
jgi:hypothetical protein